MILNFKNVLVFMLLFSAYHSALFSQTTEEYFTKEGLTFGAVFEDGFTKYAHPFIYAGPDEVCGMAVQRYTYVVYNTEVRNVYYRFEAGKVYKVFPHDCSEKLLYNFDLTLGGYFGYLQLIDVSTIILKNGEERKQFKLQDPNGNQVIWIEGIGDISTGFDAEVGILSWNGVLTFTCAKIGEELLYIKAGEEENCAFSACAPLPLEFDTYLATDGLRFVSHSTNNTDNLIWDFGDGNTSTETAPIHTYEENSCYLATLRVESECYYDGTEIEKYVSPCNATAAVRPLSELDNFLAVQYDAHEHLYAYAYQDWADTLIVNCSIDEAQNWTSIITSTPSTAASMKDLLVIDSTHFLFTTHEDTRFYTENHGLTWQELPQEVSQAPIVTNKATGELWQVDATEQNYWYSTDYGLNWTAMSIEGATIIQAMQYVENGNLLAQLPNGVAHSSDSGSTWTIVEGATWGEFIDEVHGFRPTDQGIEKTIDGGLTWTSINMNKKITTIQFTSPTHGWVSEGTNIYYTDDGLASIREFSCINLANNFIPKNDSALYLIEGSYSLVSTAFALFDMDGLGDCYYATADEDMDGYIAANDCDDTNPFVYPGAIEIPNNGIDEDCDGEDLVLVSDEQLHTNSIGVYPNPVSDLLLITLPEGVDYHIHFYNVLGQTITEGINTKQINTNTLPNGIYFMELVNLSTHHKYLKEVIVNH